MLRQSEDRAVEGSIERAAARSRSRVRAALVVEFIALFIGVPIWLWFERAYASRLVFPLIFAGLAVCLILLLRDRRFERRKLWIADGLWRDLLYVAVAFVPLAILAGMAFYLIEPQRWLALPRSDSKLWATIMVVYPIASVYPQEVIFRAFIFHRYEAVFGRGWGMIAASAIAFGMAHLFFDNVYAVPLTMAVGVLFAWTYQRTRSTLMSSIEHALWGDFAFTIGLGWYFYGGSVGAAG
ncbi:MAG: CPBP family intramembrane metalloprotease [Phycisphaeraceae bacterium]|nr:CPBP family intramembrane metalloprotease [Phycisphaeraceae bacterium]